MQEVDYEDIQQERELMRELYESQMEEALEVRAELEKERLERGYDF